MASGSVAQRQMPCRTKLRTVSQMTQNKLKELLSYDPETGVFIWRESKGSCGRGGIAGCLDESDGYVRIRIDRTGYRAHRVAWLYVYGRAPNGNLDHANKVRHDNRIKNLREGTRAQHAANRLKPRREGLKGASWSASNKKWQAQIQKDGLKIFLGYFKTEQEAHAAWWEKAQELFGEFASRE